MNIQPVSQNSFYGYDARRLKGFLMSSNTDGFAQEMQRIGEREGFKIFGIKRKGFLKWECSEGLPNALNGDDLWAQDLWTIVKGQLLTHTIDDFSEAIKTGLGLKDNFTQKIIRDIEREKLLKRISPDSILGKIILSKNTSADSSAHIQGGNLFLIKGDKKDELIIGEDELEFSNCDITDLMGMYGTEKITVLPQMDFHIDLFIRPLDKKRILITDDNLSILVLQKIYNKLSKNPTKYKDALRKTANLIKKFQKTVNENTLAQTDEVEKVLRNNGYITIRVPGRIYRQTKQEKSEESDFPYHYCNYMNANVIKNKKGKLVYITGKSQIDSMLGLTPEIINEIGYSFEKAFLNSISCHVGQNHIYFISGKDESMSELLTKYQGGIHCICTEVPEDDNNL